jgi:nicotinamidase-related amidase
MSNQDNSHRALIVIDVQNEYDGGGLPIEHPPFSQSIENIAKAMDGATAAGIKIVVVKQMAPETSPIFAKGSHGGDLHPLVKARPYDHVVEKALPSAFAGTDLDAWLRANGITTLTVIGYMTQNCDLSTIIQAAHTGFTVEALSDATGAVPYSNRAGSASAEEMHRVVMVILQARFAAVVTTSEWLEAIRTGVAPQIEGIPASNSAARRMQAA